MEKFTLEIDTGNAAFDDAPASEIARILREVATNLELHGEPMSARLIRGMNYPLRDANGNRVGWARICGGANA